MASATAFLSCSATKDNFLRLVKLLIEGGKGILKKKFDSIHPPANLPAVLQKHKVLLTNPSNRLFKDQKDKLYPSAGKYGTSDDFDITLLLFLFREICSLKPPATGWNNPPNPTDLSVEADLVRMRLYRNTIYGHASSFELDHTNFQSLWKDIKYVILRIAKSISLAEERQWKTNVEAFKTKPLTFSDENHVHELQLWYQYEMEVKESLFCLSTVLYENTKRTERIAENTKEHAAALKRVEKDSKKGAQTIEKVKENTEKNAADLRRVLEDNRDFARTLSSVDQGVSNIGRAIEELQSTPREPSVECKAMFLYIW